MIFAFMDFLLYRFQFGKYGNDVEKNILAEGHTGRIAEDTLKELEPGDTLICQRMNSTLSWAIMYFGGGYNVDHVAIYLGDGHVSHVTLTGVKVHSVHVLARGGRVLPYRPSWVEPGDHWGIKFPPEVMLDTPLPRKISKAEIQKSLQGAPPSEDLFTLLYRGMRIFLGLTPTSFRWRYFFDLLTLTLFIDLILWPINQFPIATTLSGIWFPVVLWLQIKLKIKLWRKEKIELDSHPGLAILELKHFGGYIFPREPLNGRWKTKVYPENFDLSLVRQTMLQALHQQPNPENSKSDPWQP